MQRCPLISVIILNYNGKDVILPCLSSVLSSDYPDLEVILVDNASTDDSLELVRKNFGADKRLKVIINRENLFFAGGNNTGMRNAGGEYIVILNNDTEVDKNWLKEMALCMQDPAVGACQPKMLFFSAPEVIDNVGGVLDKFGYSKGMGSRQNDSGQYAVPEEIFFAGGAAMMVKREVINKVGMFDDDFCLHWEDVDLCWRIRLNGYRIISVPNARVYHKVSQTIRKFADAGNTSFHIRKNRIAGLIKNYSLLNLARFLPVTIFFYAAVYFKEAFAGRNIRMAFTSISALLWNIKELPRLLRKRRIVQKQIRVVTDKEIIMQMYNKSIIMEQYFKPVIRK